MIQAQDYEKYEIIDAAYCSGFEPSDENLPFNDLYEEANNYLTVYLLTL